MFEFAQPYLLLLLLLPPLVYFFIPAGKPNATTALKVPFFSHLLSLTQQIKQRQQQFPWRQFLLGYLIWMLLVISCADPQWVGKPVNLPRSGRDIMLAVDLSGSMQIPDMQWQDRQVNRWTVVRHVASNFIAKRVGDRLGLILFGSKAYLQTPLTFDRQTVITMLNDASIGLAGAQTAIGDAIGLAIKRMSQGPQAERVLILLTDGRNNSGAVTPLSAAALAEKNHIRIYTIGIGADHLVVPSMFGDQVLDTSQDLDEDSLKAIAAQTGGQYFRARDAAALQRIYHYIDQAEPLPSQDAMFRSLTTYYMWPLALALLISAALALWRLLQQLRLSSATWRLQEERG